MPTTRPRTDPAATCAPDTCASCLKPCAPEPKQPQRFAIRRAGLVGITAAGLILTAVGLLCWALDAPKSVVAAALVLGGVVLALGAAVLIRPPALVRLDTDAVRVRGARLPYVEVTALEKIRTQAGPGLQIQSNESDDLLVPLRWLLPADRSELTRSLTDRVSAARRHL